MAAGHRNGGVALAIAFALSMILTGAIHVDGFADSCDALFASVPVARRLEIFKDPRHGTFAIAGVVVTSVLWLAALGSAPAQSYPLTLATAAAAARWGAVVHLRWMPHARPGDAPAAFAERPPMWILVLGLVLVTIIARHAVVEAVTGIVASSLALLWARSRLGGAVVGDTFGFAIVIGEVCALTSLAMLW